MGGSLIESPRRAIASALRHRVALASVLVALAAVVPSTAASASGLFSQVPGEMFQGRYTPAAAVLPGGKVLIAGGYRNEGPLMSAEIYDPAAGTFEQLAGEETHAHGEQATVALPDGRVLLLGGWSSVTKSLKTVEVFDPATRTFGIFPAELNVVRDGAGAVLLPGGKVFITGGVQNSGEYTRTAETYDPASNSFSTVKGLAFHGRYQPAVALLPTGKVLIAGGYSGPPTPEYMKTAEIYDPATETFEALTAGHEPVEPRDEAGVVTLQSGRVLIAGGYNAASKYLASAEVFDSATETFVALPDLLVTPREGDTGVLLPDGRALFVAGYEETATKTEEAAYLKTVEITSIAAATAVTGAAGPVGITSATGHGTVLTEAAASAYFQVGTTTAYGTTTPSVALGYGAAPQPVAVNLTGLSPATTYHYRLVATNAGGTTYGADQTFTSAPPVPSLSTVRQAHLRWREGNAGARISRRGLPLGTSFSFALNTAAKVTFAFTQRAGGRRVHGRCVAQTRHNRSARRCSRTVTRAALSFNGHTGANKVAFQGRVSHSKKLRPGAYTVVITAVGPSGASAAQHLTFTIVG